MTEANTHTQLQLAFTSQDPSVITAFVIYTVALDICVVLFVTKPAWTIAVVKVGVISLPLQQKADRHGFSRNIGAYK